MTPAIPRSVKGPLVLGIASGFCSTAIGMLWLRFPSLVPLGVLILIGLVGAVTFLVCETVVVLRIAKTLWPQGPLGREIRSVPLRTIVILGATLVLCNGLLFYLTDLRPRLVWAAAVSLAVVLSWASARRAARRRAEGTGGHRDT